MKRNDIRSEIINAAKRKETVTYKTIMTRYGVNRIRIGDLLSEIAEFEYANQRPMLTSIVVHTNSGDEHCPQGEPGAGFLALGSLRQTLPDVARRLDDLAKKLTPFEKRFSRGEQLKVFDYWAKHADPSK